METPATARSLAERLDAVKAGQATADHRVSTRSRLEDRTIPTLSLSDFSNQSSVPGQSGSWWEASERVANSLCLLQDGIKSAETPGGLPPCCGERRRDLSASFELSETSLHVTHSGEEFGNMSDMCKPEMAEAFLFAIEKQSSDLSRAALVDQSDGVSTVSPPSCSTTLRGSRCAVQVDGATTRLAGNSISLRTDELGKIVKVLEEQQIMLEEVVQDQRKCISETINFFTPEVIAQTGSEQRESFRVWLQQVQHTCAQKTEHIHSRSLDRTIGLFSELEERERTARAELVKASVRGNSREQEIAAERRALAEKEARSQGLLCQVDFMEQRNERTTEAWRQAERMVGVLREEARKQHLRAEDYAARFFLAKRELEIAVTKLHQREEEMRGLDAFAKQAASESVKLRLENARLMVTPPTIGPYGSALLRRPVVLTDTLPPDQELLTDQPKGGGKGAAGPQRGLGWKNGTQGEGEGKLASGRSKTRSGGAASGSQCEGTHTRDDVVRPAGSTPQRTNRPASAGPQVAGPQRQSVKAVDQDEKREARRYVEWEEGEHGGTSGAAGDASALLWEGEPDSEEVDVGLGGASVSGSVLGRSVDGVEGMLEALGTRTRAPNVHSQSQTRGLPAVGVAAPSTASGQPHRGGGLQSARGSVSGLTNVPCGGWQAVPRDAREQAHGSIRVTQHVSVDDREDPPTRAARNSSMATARMWHRQGVRCGHAVDPERERCAEDEDEVESDASVPDSTEELEAVGLPGPMKLAPAGADVEYGGIRGREAAPWAARQHKSTVFAALTGAEQQKLLAGWDMYGNPNCRVEMVGGNDAIVREGEATDGMALVVAGEVSVWRTERREGEVRSARLRISSVGDGVAEEEGGLQLESRFTVLSVPPRCEVVRVSEAAMEELLDQHPHLRRRLADRLAAGEELQRVEKAEAERALLAVTVGARRKVAGSGWCVDNSGDSVTVSDTESDPQPRPR